MAYASDFIEFNHVAPYKDKSFLHQKYVVEGLSIGQIADQIFSSKDAVRRGLIAAGISMRKPHKPHGRPAQPRYGTRVVEGTARPHLAEARVIRAIEEMRKQGLSLRHIAAFLSQIGVPTKCRGKGWHPQMVSRVLNNSKKDMAPEPTGQTVGATLKAKRS